MDDNLQLKEVEVEIPDDLTPEITQATLLPQQVKTVTKLKNFVVKSYLVPNKKAFDRLGADAEIPKRFNISAIAWQEAFAIEVQTVPDAVRLMISMTNLVPVIQWPRTFDLYEQDNPNNIQLKPHEIDIHIDINFVEPLSEIGEGKEDYIETPGYRVVAYLLQDENCPVDESQPATNYPMKFTLIDRTTEGDCPVGMGGRKWHLKYFFPHNSPNSITTKQRGSNEQASKLRAEYTDWCLEFRKEVHQQELKRINNQLVQLKDQLKHASKGDMRKFLRQLIGERCKLRDEYSSPSCPIMNGLLNMVMEQANNLFNVMGGKMIDPIKDRKIVQSEANKLSQRRMLEEGFSAAIQSAISKKDDTMGKGITPEVMLARPYIVDLCLRIMQYQEDYSRMQLAPGKKYANLGFVLFLDLVNLDQDIHTPANNHRPPPLYSPLISGTDFHIKVIQSHEDMEPEPGFIKNTWQDRINYLQSQLGNQSKDYNPEVIDENDPTMQRIINALRCSIKFASFFGISRQYTLEHNGQEQDIFIPTEVAGTIILSVNSASPKPPKFVTVKVDLPSTITGGCGYAVKAPWPSTIMIEKLPWLAYFNGRGMGKLTDEKEMDVKKMKEELLAKKKAEDQGSSSSSPSPSPEEPVDPLVELAKEVEDIEKKARGKQSDLSETELPAEEPEKIAFNKTALVGFDYLKAANPEKVVAISGTDEFRNECQFTDEWKVSFTAVPRLTISPLSLSKEFDGRGEEGTLHLLPTQFIILNVVATRTLPLPKKDPKTPNLFLNRNQKTLMELLCSAFEASCNVSSKSVEGEGSNSQ